MPFGRAETLGDFDDAPLDSPEHAPCGEPTRRIAFTRRDTRQDLDPLPYVVDRVEMKLVGPDGAHDVVAEDEMREIRARQDDPLRARQPPTDTQVEEPFDLGAHPANRLHLSELIHAAGHRDRLVDGEIGERRQHGEQLAR